MRDARSPIDGILSPFGAFIDGSAAFSPVSLFTSGSQGIWLDPSDLSTMFTDRAGTTPVTAPGQTVGKRLDKSGRGNHATAPTDTARLIYGVEPKTGRRNLLLATDTLATQSLTVTAVAHTLAFTGTGTVTLTGASTAGPLVGTGAGNRVSLTFTPTAASLTLTVTGSVTLGQLQLGSVDTAYQRVTTAYDVTEAGVPTCHYVQYDGVDDSMSTAAIDFTATDKMSVFAGYRILGGAGSQVVLETSAVSSLNAGSFALAQGPAASNTGFGAILNAGNGAAAQTAVLSVPYSSVATASLNPALSGITNEISLRMNGAVMPLPDTFGTDSGTGNFGNYPMFFGRRNNSNTVPAFYGRDYGIIVVGKAASAAEIASTEAYLAANTSGVTL